MQLTRAGLFIQVLNRVVLRSVVLILGNLRVGVCFREICIAVFGQAIIQPRIAAESRIYFVRSLSVFPTELRKLPQVFGWHSVEKFLLLLFVQLVAPSGFIARGGILAGRYLFCGNIDDLDGLAPNGALPEAPGVVTREALDAPPRSALP
jgi:hypothetical protein